MSVVDALNVLYRWKTHSNRLLRGIYTSVDGSPSLEKTNRGVRSRADPANGSLERLSGNSDMHFDEPYRV